MDGWRKGGRQGWMSGWMSEWMERKKERQKERKSDDWVDGWREGKQGQQTTCIFKICVLYMHAYQIVKNTHRNTSNILKFNKF